jgi:exonuclease SbcC
LANAQKTYDEAAKDYDEAKHATARTELLQLQRDQVKLESDLAAARRREAELTKELARLAETKKELQVEFAERGRLASLLEATEFIRSTLRDAAPLVAKNYVRHVSMEANQMFREIGGKAEQNLRWNDDYGITVEEGGHERPFVSLSGGEQMAAALSVRLALLKQLSEIRIAFFDEPTTNMDAERRENLAIQISQIKHFDQLFVISHDDTFEGYVDNVVHVERANNEQNI